MSASSASDASFDAVPSTLNVRGRKLGADIAAMVNRAEAALGATTDNAFFGRSLFSFGGAKTATELAASLQELLDMGAAIGELLFDANGFDTQTTPQVAFRAHGPVPADQADFTAFAHVAGLPAVSLPAPRKTRQMPVGTQLVGRRLADDHLAAHALAIEPMLETMS